MKSNCRYVNVDNVDTYTVDLSASESACSGIPYTCSYPTNVISTPIDVAPV